QGETAAAITLVEYGDYQCPHCKKVSGVIKALQRRVGSRMRYVYRHLPLRDMHPDAQKAAEAAEAAGAQGKFWEMHDLLYANQEQLGRDDLISYAAALDLDLERFTRELDGDVYAERVNEDYESAVAADVIGTPSFFINGRRYDGAWDIESMLRELEKPLGVQIRLLAQEFTRIQASGGLLLLGATILALIFANSALAEAYFEFWRTDFTITLGSFSLTAHLYEWVNDGLMAIFFLVVGLEIKREILEGELGSAKRAALPVAAAVGGLAVPAVIYLAFNLGTPGANGWGIPIATDIAFTLGILVLLGSRVPLTLKIFFTAFAIVDDIGAVMVITFFYSHGVELVALGAGAVILILLIILNRIRVYNLVPYVILGILLWVAFLEAGIHPTVAGVLLALVIPNRSAGDPRVLLAQCTTILNEYDSPGTHPARLSSREQAATQTLEAISESLQSPSQRLEHALNPWSTYLILPIFAFANAGVPLATDIGSMLSNPVSIGILAGLLIGKPLGITLFSWITIRIGLAQLPRAVSFRQLAFASILGGIGFTISLFITNSAFSDPEVVIVAKLAILVASLIAGVVGFALVWFTSPQYDEHSMIEVELAPSPET
ncbi:MAG: Na+/H+ antiporter NhaA, partial [Anaerolineales bacterium]|nr:Na+/H+ antiporter NhaA [Anaerolineales bacterium]